MKDSCKLRSISIEYRGLKYIKILNICGYELMILLLMIMLPIVAGLVGLKICFRQQAVLRLAS